jgi:hypothetical protein
MMILFKSLQVLAGACALIFIPTIAFAKTPTYYHYYYVYPESITWCGKLVAEVFTNTDKNWHFTEKKLTDTTAAFSVGDVRGFLRCLAKQSKESWVVIITTGNDSNKTKDLFEELRLGVCGKCSALAD